MIKLKFDTTGFDTSEIVEGFRSRFKSATSAMMADAKAQGQKLAASRLKVGLKNWLKGYKMHKVSDDFYIIEMEGLLGSWMEDGIQPGEVSKAIMSGNRAESNKGQGKNYVDVPIAKDADELGNIALGKSGPKVNVRAFANADQLVKFINASDWKRGGVQRRQVVQSRVKDIIKNVEPKSGKTSYMTIRRVTEDSKWPKSPFRGAKVFEELDSYIDSNFDKILERFI